MRSERRRYRRYDIEAPISIEHRTADESVGVSRNLGGGGVLFHCPAPYALGERLKLCFPSGTGAGPVTIEGIVVRSRFDPGYILPYAVAVEFDAPCPARLLPRVRTGEER